MDNTHWWIILTALLVAISYWENRLDWIFTSIRAWHMFGYIWLAFTILIIMLAVFSFTGYFTKLRLIFSWLINKLGRFKWISQLFFGLMMVVFPYLVFGDKSRYFENFYFRAAVLWLISGLATVALKSLTPQRKFIHSFFFTLLIATALYQSVSYLRDISTYSLSLGWSEGSRFYYASLPFAMSIYGKALPLSFLHPSRYLLMSLPFVIKGLPLWVHRAWQVFLWLFLTALGSYSLTQRLKLNDWMKIAALTAWSFVFFFQGPVYYHLMLCVIIVLWGYSKDKYIRSLMVVIVASIWAGISRVNWFPLPGALAAILLILETPYTSSKNFMDYFCKPIVFIVIGLAASVVAQTAYIALSGNQDVSVFGTSFSSDLLWYRLLPSPTYPVGILTGILLLCSPLIILILLHFMGRSEFLHPIRKIAIILIVGVFFAGGLVVSVKIGGGSNLHNLDAFLVLLTCLCAYLLFEKYAYEKVKRQKHVNIPALLLLLILMLPVGWSLSTWEPFPALNKNSAYRDVLRLQEETEDTSEQNEEILFISERQTLTFGRIHDVPLVDEYELLTLMEMAMANNQSYLQQFYKDLKNQRFGLIITNKQYVVFKDSSRSFPEENNAWVQRVVVPLMQYYQPITWMRDTGIEIFARRDLAQK